MTITISRSIIALAAFAAQHPVALFGVAMSDAASVRDPVGANGIGNSGTAIQNGGTAGAVFVARGRRGTAVSAVNADGGRNRG